MTEGTVTIGTLGPPLTTRFTVEFFDTDAPAAGLVDSTMPLGCELVWEVVVPTVRLSFCSVWTATLDVSPTTSGTVTLPPSDRAQQEEGDHREGEQEHDEDDDEAARPLLPLEIVAVREGGPPSAGTAIVRPVVVGTASVAPTAASMEVTPGSAASTGRPSAKRSRSARSSSADR